MITEYILLMLLSVGILGAVVLPSRNIFRSATPQLAVRMEKHIMTGYLHSVSHCKTQSTSCWKE